MHADISPIYVNLKIRTEYKKVLDRKRNMSILILKFKERVTGY